MTHHNPVLQHLPFFEALALLSEEGPEWRATSAGLVTLRLFDAWVEEGPSAVAADSWGLRAVRDAIGAVDRRITHRALLTSIVDAMTAAPIVRMATVAPRLMAYARALQMDARWTLAANVYRTVIAHAHPVEDADVVISANMQLGACFRMMAEWHEAAAAYVTAGEIAAMTGDIMNVLRSRVSEANIAIDRGNLPHAEEILEETIARARDARLHETAALALHARAHVAHLRRDYELAIRLGYEALEGTREQTSRDRILGDIATSFTELGVHSAARDAYLLLAATAQEQYVRWTATINLMELASLDRIEPVFEQYRRELVGSSMPPALSAYYYYYVGQGYRMFDRTELARVALERAAELASAHQINQVLFQAEASLSELKSGRRATIPASTWELERDGAPETREVASSIRGLRETAGVSG